MDRIFVIFGALSAFIGVTAGAFGAHGFRFIPFSFLCRMSDTFVTEFPDVFNLI